VSSTGLLARSLYKISRRWLLARSPYEISVQAPYRSTLGKISVKDLLASKISADLYKRSRGKLSAQVSLYEVSWEISSGYLCTSSL
jgi:hypothetical protein